MTNTQLLLLITVLVVCYLYWKQLPKAKTAEIIYETEFPNLEPQEIPADQQDWFTEQHWLTDSEIDWALAQLAKLPNYKILPAYIFHYLAETHGLEANAYLAFPDLLSELTGWNGELVFIPVNNPDFHWSLLVYEVKEKKFYHFDTLGGTNDSYVKPLVKELLIHLLQTNEPGLKDYLATRYHLKQGNTWDCGIAVIEIAKAIIKDYPTFKKVLLYTKLDFNFAEARKDWRQTLENTYD